MSNYNTLKSQVAAAITTNGNEEITGQVLRELINNNIIPSLGSKYQFAGVATPTTNPGTPDYKVAYIAATAGTYANMGNFILQAGEIAVLYRDTSWHKETIATIAQPAIPYILTANDSPRRYLIVRFDNVFASSGNVDVEISGVNYSGETAYRGTYHICASEDKIAADYVGDAIFLTAVSVYHNSNYDYLVFDFGSALSLDVIYATVIRKNTSPMPVEVSFSNNLPQDSSQMTIQWPQVDTPMLQTLRSAAGNWVLDDDVAEFNFSTANSFAGRVIEIHTADAGGSGAAYGVTIPSTSASFGEALLIVSNNNESGNLCSISGPIGFYIEDMGIGKTAYINLLLTPFGVYVKSYHII